MATRSQLFKMIPWEGGVNSQLDESMISPNQLTLADNIEFGERGTRKKRDGIKQNYDSNTDGSDTIIGHHDFWYGASSKTQSLVSITTGKKFYSYTTGTSSADLFAGTAWATTPTVATFTTLNNLAILAVDGGTNVMKKWTGSGNIADLGGTPPAASISRSHLSRLWCNDKSNVDRLNYSTTANPEEWNGAGDSGALDIGVGDGDPEGITAIFPTFQGALFVAKRTKLYRIDGDAPENFDVVKVSDTLGCVSHNSIATIDERDIIFVSERGVHSLTTTAQFGDFEGQYISYDIQKTFNDKFVFSRLKYIWGEYLPNKNCYYMTVTDSDISSTANNSVWAYHFPTKAWHRVIKGFGVSSLKKVKDIDKPRLYAGSTTGRIWKIGNGTNYDISGSGSSTAILYKVKTGIIYPDGNQYTVKAFKRFILFYKAEGTHTITVTLKIDNYPSQAIAFTNTASNALLGSTFVLGSSVLGSSSVAAPYAQSIDGYGHGIQVTIENAAVDQIVEIQGFAIEWEPAEWQQEVVQSVS